MKVRYGVRSVDRSISVDCPLSAIRGHPRVLRDLLHKVLLNEPLFREAGGGPEGEDDCSYCFAAIIVGCPKFDIGPLCFAVVLRPLQHEHCPPHANEPRPNGSRSTETLSSLSGVKTRGAELNESGPRRTQQPWSGN
jgi:hypothetical protein